MAYVQQHKFISPISPATAQSIQSIQSAQSIQSIQSIQSAQSTEKLHPESSPISYAHIHGCSGIITAYLTDPLSQLISKIMELSEGTPNAVGFYYETKESNTHTVLLFNIYDNDPIPWLRLGYTMSSLLASQFITRITYYPLIAHESDSVPLLAKNTLQGAKNLSDLSGIQDMFRTIIIDTISTSTRSDTCVSYTSMLLRFAGVAGVAGVAGIASIAGVTTNLVNLATGYSLVNKVLLALMGSQSEVESTTSIIPCPILKNPISLISPSVKPDAAETEYVIEESRREITKLMGIFIDLFTTHDGFRSNVMNKSSTNTVNSSTGCPPDKLLVCESELVSYIVGSLQNGVLSNEMLNGLIRNLSGERWKLGVHRPLPTSTHPSKQLSVTKGHIPCTFQQSYLPHRDLDAIKDLGIYISHIVNSFDSPETMSINLGGLVTAYNNAISGTNLTKIVIPKTHNTDKSDKSSHTLSKQAIVTIPGDRNTEMISAPVDSHTILIPIYNGNLTLVSEDQLLDILIYIDSLRDSNGTSDTRFANLQNEITHELAHRRRIKNAIPNQK
jgi:hypothetical protein